MSDPNLSATLPYSHILCSTVYRELNLHFYCDVSQKATCAIFNILLLQMFQTMEYFSLGAFGFGVHTCIVSVFLGVEWNVQENPV